MRTHRVVVLSLSFDPFTGTLDARHTASGHLLTHRQALLLVQPVHTPASHRPCKPLSFGPPDHAGKRASILSLQGILQHRLVQRQVRHQLLELAVLFFQLLEPADLRHAKTIELLFPAVERRLGIPNFRTISPTVVPDSACRRAKAIWASVYRFFFICCSLLGS